MMPLLSVPRSYTGALRMPILGMVIVATVAGRAAFPVLATAGVWATREPRVVSTEGETTVTECLSDGARVAEEEADETGRNEGRLMNARLEIVSTTAKPPRPIRRYRPRLTR